ncbi:hypothetical protein, partial [uncultured Senegalimassilia sp.]|uniref:hypothetical protein n=1 Tax=uncultured Senegalimassilia sp. TaxID=1714350 RepID=UPI0025FA1583
QSAICNLQSAICNLQSAICNLQSAICNQGNGTKLALCQMQEHSRHGVPTSKDRQNGDKE